MSKRTDIAKKLVDVAKKLVKQSASRDNLIGLSLYTVLTDVEKSLGTYHVQALNMWKNAKKILAFAKKSESFGKGHVSTLQQIESLLRTQLSANETLQAEMQGFIKSLKKVHKELVI